MDVFFSLDAQVSVVLPFVLKEVKQLFLQLWRQTFVAIVSRENLQELLKKNAVIEILVIVADLENHVGKLSSHERVDSDTRNQQEASEKSLLVCVWYYIPKANR